VRQQDSKTPPAAPSKALQWHVVAAGACLIRDNIQGICVTTCTETIMPVCYTNAGKSYTAKQTAAVTVFIMLVIYTMYREDQAHLDS